MRQQINLYQRTRPIHIQVSAGSLLLASCIMLAALLSIWTFAQIAVIRLQHQVEVLQQQRQAQENLLSAANTLYQEKIDPAALQLQVAQLKQTLQEHQTALVLLRHRPPTAQQGFANRLQALAHPHIDGVWLEGVALDDQPGIQSLRGRSVSPTLVATYLHALGSEPALAGTRFNDVRILGPKYVESGSTADIAVSKPLAHESTEGVRFRVDNHVEATQVGSAT